MRLESINPATGEQLASFDFWDDARLEQALAQAAEAARDWRARPLAERAELVGACATRLRADSEHLARLATNEMGKPIREARAEVEKSAWACEFYAENAEAMLRAEPVATDASRSYVTYQPLGTVFAIMPWNFPFWQVFRHVAPTLAAGNTLLLKHAPNVPLVAAAIEELLRDAGMPDGVFINLPIDIDQSARVIGDPRVHAITLTGSERAGRAVAALAGQHLKKAVLELGGSDPFIVLDDADLDLVLSQAITARFQNNGQSCIAAKRMILTPSVADTFAERFVEAVRTLKVGDPLKEDIQVGPMARSDLRDQLARQIADSLAAGARCLVGGETVDGPGYFHAPTVLDGVGPGMPAYEEELFGPVATLIRVRDAEEALEVANGSRYGLGGSVWTADSVHGERVAQTIESGCAFVNGMVKSDPRLPFGGVKASGYGRELGVQGIHEFVNVRAVWIR